MKDFVIEKERLSMTLEGKSRKYLILKPGIYEQIISDRGMSNLQSSTFIVKDKETEINYLVYNEDSNNKIIVKEEFPGKVIISNKDIIIPPGEYQLIYHGKEIYELTFYFIIKYENEYVSFSYEQSIFDTQKPYDIGR